MGRPRKQKKRDSKGRIKASEYRKDFEHGAAKWAKVRDVMRDIGTDPRLSSHLGKLYFMGEISASQYEAANEWGAHLDVFDWKVLGVRRSVAAHVLDRINGRDDTEKWDTDRIERFKSRYYDIEAAVSTECGEGALFALNRLCRGEHARIIEVRSPLEFLVSVFNMDRSLDDSAQIRDDEKRKVLIDTP